MKLRQAGPWYSLFGQPQITVAIASMVASVFLFASVDVLVKLLGDHYSAAQIFFFRSLFALVPALLSLRLEGGLKNLKTNVWPLHLLGSLLMMAFLICNFVALPRISLAEFYVISYAAPIMTVALGALILREKLNFSQFAAVLVGFSGTIIIFQPSGNVFNLGGFLTLLGTLLFSVTMILVRILGRTESSSVISTYFALFGTLTSAILLPWVWVTPDLRGLILLTTLGVLGGIGQLLMAKAFKDAAVILISPFQYTSILWGVLFGYFVFETLPDLGIIPGLLIIAASGVFLLMKNR